MIHTVEKNDWKLYNIFGDEASEILEENNYKNIEKTNESTNQLYRKNQNGLKELEDSSFSCDSQGRTLAKEQQEYFKDNKFKDDKIENLILHEFETLRGLSELIRKQITLTIQNHKVNQE